MRITNQLTVNYSKAFGKHTLSALAGASVEKFDAWYTWMRGSNFPSDELQYINEAGTKEETSSSKSEEKINSLFGRINYNFNNKYIAEFSLRRDGSSIFGPNNKFAYLPSFSVAYRLIEEPFIKKIEAIDELKLKIGYGLIGNDQIGRNQYANLYSGGYNYVGMPGLVPKQIPNPNLKWETSKNFNIGLDLGMYNRIFLGMEFYRNNTVDLLMQRPIPGSSGFGFFMDNVGNLINQGFEFSLNGTIVNKALVWNSSVNLSFNRNKITKMYNGQPILDQGRGNNAAIEGQPIGVFFMYRSLGVDPSTGDIVFEDLNHDEAITDEDRQIVGDPNPDFTGGFINKLAYKGFDLNVFFQFSYGNQIFNGTRQYAEAMKFGTSDNQLATIKDRWQKPGDITYIPRHDGINNLFPVSSKYIEDGSYLRLKEITLGYNFPKRIVDNLRNISKIRLYLKSQNLLTFTNYSGLDPEVNYAGKTNIVQGTDFFTYPIPRSFIFGFNLEF
jgi:TonB-linked SusC/RagA family outer membrane protein